MVEVKVFTPQPERFLCLNAGESLGAGCKVAHGWSCALWCGAPEIQGCEGGEPDTPTISLPGVRKGKASAGIQRTVPVPSKGRPEGRRPEGGQINGGRKESSHKLVPVTVPSCLTEHTWGYRELVGLENLVGLGTFPPGHRPMSITQRLLWGLPRNQARQAQVPGSSPHKKP